MTIREALAILKEEDPDMYARIQDNGMRCDDIQLLLYADQLRKKKQKETKE